MYGKPVYVITNNVHLAFMINMTKSQITFYKVIKVGSRFGSCYHVIMLSVLVCTKLREFYI